MKVRFHDDHSAAESGGGNGRSETAGSAAVNNNMRVFRFPGDDSCLCQGLTSRGDADICESGGISGVIVQNNAG